MGDCGTFYGVLRPILTSYSSLCFDCDLRVFYEVFSYACVGEYICRPNARNEQVASSWQTHNARLGVSICACVYKRTGSCKLGQIKHNTGLFNLLNDARKLNTAMAKKWQVDEVKNRDEAVRRVNEKLRNK